VRRIKRQFYQAR